VRFDIVVYDGIDELDAVGPFEVLRKAEALGANVESNLVSPVARDMVTGACGLRFQTDDVLRPGAAEVVIVVGGGWATRSDVGAWGEVQRGMLTAQLAEVAPTASIMAGVCTGTMLLAHAGLLSGRRASTHHAAMADLATAGAVVIDERVVDDGDVVTCGGVTSGIDLALWLVEREIDRSLADRIARGLEYKRTRPTTAVEA